jgi:diadenosine tetraphosphate (Ap4A) HIT family hydrolase
MTSTVCLYCDQGARLTDAMIEICPLDVSTAYLFREQTYAGRCVVAYSRGHVAELFELSDTQRDAFMRDVARVASAVASAVGAAKINYGAYGDKTPHLHFHIVPKREDGPDWGGTFEMMPEPRIALPEEEYAALAERIMAQLS